MQLCFRITTFVVAVLLLWPELSLDLTRMAANLCQIFSSRRILWLSIPGHTSHEPEHLHIH